MAACPAQRLPADAHKFGGIPRSANVATALLLFRSAVSCLPVGPSLQPGLQVTILIILLMHNVATVARG